MTLWPAAKVCSTYPILEESGAIDLILPKKEQAVLAKLYAYPPACHYGSTDRPLALIILPLPR